MPPQEPATVNKLLPGGKSGRGRPNGMKPLILVMHIQEGTNDLSEYFKGVDADSTMWNPPGDGDKLIRLLKDEDTAWTNGPWDRPNLQNPVIANLFKSGISTNDVSLTIEHAGFHNKPISEAQLNRSVDICAWWCQKWGIQPDRDHIIGHYEVGPHKDCPGLAVPLDRLVGRVRAKLDLVPPVATGDPTIIPITYDVIVPDFVANVRSGPGKAYPIVATIKADPKKRYTVDGEAHGELIGSDDVWSHLVDAGGGIAGFITRTALMIVH